MSQKICTDCNELKDYENFSPLKRGRGGVAAKCKPCTAKRTKAWVEANPDKNAARIAEWRKNNKDKIREQVRAWRDSRPGAAASHTAKRKSAKLQRTPPWLSKEQRAEIEKYYAEAMRLTQILGEQYEVDHIVPLRGKKVSGLHVPWNLQVIKGSENARKHNKFTVDPE